MLELIGSLTDNMIGIDHNPIASLQQVVDIFGSVHESS
jgi:hypothetical protein